MQASSLVVMGAANRLPTLGPSRPPQQMVRLWPPFTFWPWLLTTPSLGTGAYNPPQPPPCWPQTT